MKKSVNNQETFVIQDLDTLRVVTDPVRAQILEILTEKQYRVKDVADKLGLAASKLYYHFNLLEKHGLIKVVDTRQVANLIEKWYSATATYLSVDPGLLAFSPSSENEALISVVQTVIDATREDLARSFHARAYNLKFGAQEKPRQAILNRTLGYLDDEKAAELQKRMQELIEEFTQSGQVAESEQEKRQLYALTVAFYPSFYFEGQQDLSAIESENNR